MKNSHFLLYDVINLFIIIILRQLRISKRNSKILIPLDKQYGNKTIPRNVLKLQLNGANMIVNTGFVSKDKFK